jgi:hypothetical protein
VNYQINRLDDATVFNLYLDREELWLDPPYQRAADIWPLDKKQLLIDSILNGFDIPKFYFHDFYPGKKIVGKNYRYAIIDGKQRLDAIWGFIDNEYPLSHDIELVNQPDVEVTGLTYSELAEQHPRLKARFDSRALAVITIQTDDTELIEEMFSRLNEAVPLSAAEKRNAFRGPIPPVIRRLSEHRFFTEKVPFSNSRYRHYDLLCKFLLLADSDEIVDLKKAYLDGFVIEFRDYEKKAEAKALEKQVRSVLNRMEETFVGRDELLRSLGMVTLYFILYAGIESKDWTKRVPRSHLERFEDARGKNREVAEADVADASYELLEFDRWAQSPNDSVALDYRFRVLRRWLSRRTKK